MHTLLQGEVALTIVRCSPFERCYILGQWDVDK